MLEAKILSEGPETILAFIVEPVGGASTGALVPPKGYMQRIREICTRYGVLLIHDEVMTGGGRTGKFFAGEHWNVDPDILVISKGFAAGYAPLGAMIAHNDIVTNVLDNGGFLHGFTYAGNPLACSAGLAVLEEIERENLCQNAAETGALLKSELKKLMERYSIIGDVRGEGLLLAFELVEDRASLRPLAKELNAFNELVDIAYENGLIIYSRRTRGGYSGDHFLIAPPMISTADHVAEIIEGLDLSLRQFLDRISRQQAKAS
jgi:adenosylmethionine-8-amino-7-oxononanoate aminotransferase